MEPKSYLQKFRIPLEISSWVTFAIALTFYWITTDPDISYWDCPEYVTLASRLEVGHPPGNPIWMLTMRVATIPFAAEHHAYVINLFSGIFMAFATFFVCRIIFMPVRIYLQKRIHSHKLSIGWTDSQASFVSSGAALCFALCDSSWYSAVEAEVYAMSTFLMALSLWIMMVWWFEKSGSKKIRLLILLAYITGISLGVHQLNLLLIPVFVLVYLYKNHRKRVNPLYVFLCLIFSCCFIGIILMVIMPGFLYGAQSFELFGVNILGLPYNSGILIFTILLFILLVIFLLLLNHPRSPLINISSLLTGPSTILWIFAFLILGYSSFGIILTRANSYPYVNEGVPDNIFALKSYIEREQYPTAPLLYGATPYSRPLFVEDLSAGQPHYSRYILKKNRGIYKPFTDEARLNYRSGMVNGEDSLLNDEIKNKGRGYILADYTFEQELTPELNMWFPRLTSRKVSDREAYADWAGMTEETMDKIPVSETVDSTGQYQPRKDIMGNRGKVYSYRPTYMQNLQYFISYQAYYMYFRYLFWNFIGRQNDYHSIGEIEHGNFITGIPSIDRTMIGDPDYYPDEIGKNNKGRNRYFGIPFLLGIFGIIWLLAGGRKGRRAFSVIGLIFIMTGLAIVVYLNQLPGEPRERDYTFLGSYMAYVMWIGAGFLGLSQVLLKFLSKKTSVVLCCMISLCPATLMAFENFDDHNRRGRFEPSFYSSSLLDFEYPSIIFSHGDNSTFPLWYSSEVLGKGDDHTIVDVSYLSMPSYVVNLKRQGNKGIKTLLPTPDLAYGAFLQTQLPADTLPAMQLADALRELYASKASTPVWPTTHVTLSLSHNDSIIINLRDFTGGSSFLSFRHLMLLDLLAGQLESDNPKMLFFPSLIDYSLYKPLSPILKNALFGKIIFPELTDSMAAEMLRKSVERELSKLDNVKIEPHYSDPLIADRSRRYRGELIIAANDLLQREDTILPAKIVEYIESYYPYSELLPGDFTVADSTFYEGKEYSRLLQQLYETTDSDIYISLKEGIDTLMLNRKKEWMRFYNSLTPNQRKTLSNRSKRLLIK